MIGMTGMIASRDGRRTESGMRPEAIRTDPKLAVAAPVASTSRRGIVRRAACAASGIRAAPPDTSRPQCTAGPPSENSGAPLSS
jgi:hypothetical protein